MSESLPAHPILELVEARGGLTRVLGLYKPGDPLHMRGEGALAEDPDVRRWKGSFRRIASRGVVSPWLADRICIELLGVNPALVYGQAWFDAIPNDGEAA